MDFNIEIKSIGVRKTGTWRQGMCFRLCESLIVLPVYYFFV